MTAFHTAAAEAAHRLGVPFDHVLIEVATGRLLVCDRPASDPERQVVRTRRPSRSGSGLWFTIEKDRVSGLVDFDPPADNAA